MAWLVARPVASAATACLYAHGDASRRPRTCVDVRALSRQSPARCATRSLRHQVCAHADGELVRELKGHTGWVNSAAVSADGVHVVTASADATARVWRLVAS